MSDLQSAVEAGKAAGKLALYFGCWEGTGHYLHRPNGGKLWHANLDLPGFPWSDSLMDGGLLRNGRRPDRYDGKVFWTCGGLQFWYAFYWWDNSVDHRGASNSGFYVRGFGWPEADEAFDYAKAMFPKVVSRQMHALILQDPRPQHSNKGERHDYRSRPLRPARHSD
ncbi:hypothetical protein [Mesorhizobium sp. M00.F.Ca.ET.217.01.1.1]|uniref:hypothetical protein n=1 Tax=Mesorhizobium sp. M00.F.Ca.ET.217.01.1.1 TaxID=2500529 RepID=UPI000FDB3369|nr:hypothetical protein [Mesorhizobium sp. M00.F.Ca.ET.217.01.1.1]TGQ19274.1 hypothetical protein EN860_019265 [Mesorhizobium sp. M00.F.Ca.ET.217.01.1.1]